MVFLRTVWKIISVYPTTSWQLVNLKWVANEEPSTAMTSVRDFMKIEGNTKSYSMNKGKAYARIQVKLEIGTRRAQIPRKPLIFPSPNKQTNRRTNRQTKKFVHTEVPTLDPRVFSTMLLPTEL